jgi:hypothetical protein
VALAVIVTLAVAAGLRALRIGGHAADVLAGAAAAIGVAWLGWGLELVPWACLLGWGAHLLGDACTDQGVPLAWPASLAHLRVLPEPFAFTTGTRPERFFVTPLLWATLGWLAWHAAHLPAIHL